LDATIELSRVFSSAGNSIEVFIDLNTGMKRSGIKPENAMALFHKIRQLPGVGVVGLHGYDGHISDKEFDERQERSDKSYAGMAALLEAMEAASGEKIIVVAGGTPTFPTHVNRRVECSPGTFVFWDYGY